MSKIIFTILQKFSRAHWLIFIVNKWTDTWIYNLCDASTSESAHHKRQINVSYPNINQSSEYYFDECGEFLPFWAISTSATRFYHFGPHLRMQHVFTILTYFFASATHFYHFDPFLRVRLIFTILSHLTSTTLSISSHFWVIFFVEKYLLVGASSTSWVVDKSVSQWVSQWVRDVCISHQSDWICYKQPIKFLVVKVNGM